MPFSFPYFQQHPYWNPLVPRQPESPYPPVNTARLQASAGAVPALYRKANLLLNKIRTDTEFAKQLQTAAQADRKEEVKRLIHSVIRTEHFDVSYTPGGIRLELAPDQANQCANLEMFLCW